MTDQRPFSDLTPSKLLARAAKYRRMAATAATANIRDALLRLAQCFEDRVIGFPDNDNDPAPVRGLVSGSANDLLER